MKLGQRDMNLTRKQNYEFGKGNVLFQQLFYYFKNIIEPTHVNNVEVLHTCMQLFKDLLAYQGKLSCSWK